MNIAVDSDDSGDQDGELCEDKNIDPLEAFYKGYGKAQVDHRENIVEEKKVGEIGDGLEWDGGQMYLGSKIT